jgi:hypothetical protein
MMEFLSRVEQTGFSTWVRESPSMFAYPMILFLHTVGLAFLVGPSVALVARILGLAQNLPLAPMERFYRVMWIGFWINVGSGTVLLIADAATKLINWDFYVKLVFIAAAVVLLKQLRKRVFHDPAGAFSARMLGVGLLLCWTGAITAGRLMAYLGPVSGAPGLNNKF